MSGKIVRTKEGNSFICVLDSIRPSFLKNLALISVFVILLFHFGGKKKAKVQINTVLSVPASPSHSHSFILY